MYNMKLLGLKFRFEVVIISMFIGALLSCFLFGSCCKVPITEVFSPLKRNVQWKGIKGRANNDISTGICSVHGSFCANAPNRPNITSNNDVASNNGPFSDKMFFFSNTEFKPECCGSEFSNSQGCACITDEQKQFINGRGGNRTKISGDSF